MGFQLQNAAGQLFGLVFGYLSVARMNTSLARYWEGASCVRTMHSKWSDACMQLISFDRLESSDTVIDEPFCQHVVLQFKQLSALATIYPHGEALIDLDVRLSTGTMHKRRATCAQTRGARGARRRNGSTPRG